MERPPAMSTAAAPATAALPATVLPTTTAEPAEVEYPYSDDQPMAESDFQLAPLVYAITALRAHFHPRQDVYVCGDMFLYFREGDPRSVVAPDVFVVIGAPPHRRWSYKLWEEPKAPDFILEVTSRSTRHVDQGRKRDVYASLGVGEYWLFDPTGDYLSPRLQGFELRGGTYRSPSSVIRPSGGPGLHSKVLGLELRVEGEDELRFHDPATGEDLPAYEELWTKVQEESAALQAAQDLLETRLEEEATARRAAEARIAELEARLGRST